MNAIEATFEASRQYPGFAMTDKDPAFNNFKTAKYDAVDIEDHRLAVTLRTALLRLQVIKNLSPSQFQKCIEDPGLTLSSFCTIKPLDCNPDTTK